MLNQLSRRRFLKLVGLSGASVILANCAPPSQLAPAPSSTGATAAAGRQSIRLAASAAQGLFEPPQPFGFRTGPSFARSSFLFDMLTWRDSTPQSIPWLAEKWTASDDGTGWIFTLRDGVKFQDGQPLTVDDVVFSYQYILANATSWYSSLVDVFKDITAPDTHTVHITLKTPYAPFLSSITANVPIIPKHIWSNVKDPVKFNDPTAFIGSGPYHLQSFSQADSSFLFTANDDFFLGKPYVQQLAFVPVGNDDLVALKAGNVDVATPTVTEGFATEALDYFKNDPKYAIMEAPGEGTIALHFNLTHGEPYSTVAFRQAILYAIDRKDLVTRILNGNGDPGSAGYLSPGNPYAPPSSIEPYAYDLDKAKTLLDQAGYPEQNGQRVKPDGSPLTIPLLFPTTATRTAELIRDYLAKVGLKVELNPVDPATANQRQGEGNYDLALVIYGGLGSDPDFMRRAFNSPDQAKFWWKAWGYKNPDFAKLATEQLRTLDDNKRHDLVAQMQRIIAQDVPVMPLYYPTRLLVSVPSVFDNWYYTPLWNPLALNKHSFVTGQKTGLTIRSS